jgi:hypothetical protein
MTAADTRGRARSPHRTAPSVLMAMLRARRLREAGLAPITSSLDPGEAAILRQSLESGYRHATDAAMRAYSPGERGARLALASELRSLAGAEPRQRVDAGALSARSGWRGARHAAAIRDAGIERELEAGA